MLSITRDLHIQVLCIITLKLPARYDTLHVVGSPVFTEPPESAVGLCAALLRWGGRSTMRVFRMFFAEMSIHSCDQNGAGNSHGQSRQQTYMIAVVTWPLALAG